MVIKLRYSLAFFLLCLLALAASAGAAELQSATGPALKASNSGSHLYLLPARQTSQELLPINSKVGKLSIGTFHAAKKSDTPLENAGLSLTGTTAAKGYNLNGTIDLSKGKTAVSLAIRAKHQPATLGLLYLYDQADKADSRNRTPLMILPHIGSSLLLPGQSGGDIKTYGLYADYSLSKKVGIQWAMGYAAANNDRTSLDKKAWEYNVGVAYKFFKNFMYEAHFGYLTTGDSATPAVTQQTAPVEEVYMVTNNISMKF